MLPDELRGIVAALGMLAVDADGLFAVVVRQDTGHFVGNGTRLQALIAAKTIVDGLAQQSHAECLNPVPFEVIGGMLDSLMRAPQVN